MRTVSSRTVFALTALVLAMPAMRGLSVFDEGLIATGSLAVLNGALPYRDFHTPYGPGTFYLHALLFRVFGADLLVLRVVHVLCLSAIVALIHRIARQLSPKDHWAASAASLLAIGAVLACRPSAGYPAYPAEALLLLAVALLRPAEADASHPMPMQRFAIASTAVGMAGVIRWDLGLFGIAALGLTTLLDRRAAGASWPVTGRSAALSGAPAALVMTIGYVPLLALTPPQHWVDDVLGYVFLEMAKWREIEFVRPMLATLSDSVREGRPVAFLNALFRLAFLALPVVLPVAALLQVARRTRDRVGWTRGDTVIVLLAITVVLQLNQMRVRPSLWQGLPAFLFALPLLAVTGPAVLSWLRARPGWRWPVASATALIVAAVSVSAGVSVHKSLEGRAVGLPAAHATGIRLSSEPAAAYDALLRYVWANTEPGEPVYSGVRDHRRLLINDVAFYFLANRPSPTRFAELVPGLSNTEAGQARIIEGLRRARVRMVVLLDIASEEPNLSSRAVVPDTLDRYLSENYREVRRFGSYRVLLDPVSAARLDNPLPTLSQQH